MNFIEDIRLGQEGAQAGIGTEQYRPAAVCGARIILRIGVTEDPSAQGNELLVFLVLRNRFGHGV